MKMHLRIINERPELLRPEITFKLWNRGTIVTNCRYYRLVKNAVVAAKRLSRKLHIEIISTTYCEPSNDYEQPLS